MKLQGIRIRDPYIILHKDIYYMVGTTGDDCWNAGSNFMVYKSTDLLTFDEAGYAFNPAVIPGAHSILGTGDTH